ncbi:MAG TPA: hypothetical protein VHP33_15350 [Polyangiaceae bacterium]|nr:hypothetical protein [Polyangiaceae bacterium]
MTRSSRILKQAEPWSALVWLCLAAGCVEDVAAPSNHGAGGAPSAAGGQPASLGGATAGASNEPSSGSGAAAGESPSDAGGTPAQAVAGQGGEVGVAEPAALGGVGGEAGINVEGGSAGAFAAGAGGAAPNPAGERGESGAAGAGGAGAGVDPGLPYASLPCDVQAALRARCTTCHGTLPVNDAPMSLTSWEDFNAYAQAIQEKIEQEMMPPPGAPNLSSAQQATLVSYASLGAPPVLPSLCR